MLLQSTTTDLLAKLISIPSKTHEEKKIANFILDWLRTNGVPAKMQDENIVACIKGINQDKALILTGHIDTVATGPLEAWNEDPYEPMVKDGMMNGLGASDMKAGVAVFMELAVHYSKHVPKCDVWFAFVVGEEIDGRGSQSFLKWFTKQSLYFGYKHIEAIIGEPTDNAALGVGHRGNMFVEIMFSGDGLAKYGIAPEILHAGDLIKKLESLEVKWKKQFAHKSLGAPSIGLTSITTKARKCSIVLDIRTVPKLHNQTTDLLKDFCSKLSFKTKVRLMDDCPAGWTEENTELRQLFSRAYKDIPQKVFEGAADLCFFTENNISTVIFGPGQREKMHAANESFELAKIPVYQQIIMDIASRYGGV